jgi:RNA ligase (TIGR02306 family)
LLVSVCEVTKASKCENADKLSIIECLGWQCITGLDQYKVGDIVIFIPPDSIVPPSLIEKYELTYLKNGGRVGTAKLRGCISQGLVLGIDVLEGKKVKIGDNVAEILGITKWEPPVAGYSAGQANPVSKRKLNPLFDKYTDIENIKNYPSVFQNGDMVSVTEKIHGANFRASTLPIVIDKKQPLLEIIKLLWKKYILRDTHVFCYGSHNVQLHSGNNDKNYYGVDKWGQICKMYDLKNKIPKDYIVYGEMYGNVQDLKYGVEDIDLVVFDIKYKNKYLPWGTVKALCKWWELPTVPELYVGEYYDGILTDFTDGKSLICPSQIKEGIVIKDFNESFNPKVGRKILKSVSVDYLLRKGKPTEFK